MSFFNKYNGTTDARLLRMERVIWPLMYGGLVALVLAWFTENTQAADAGALYGAGGLAVAASLAVFFWRARQMDT